MRNLPTYGEEYTRWNFDINGFEYPFDEVPPIRSHLKRMKPEEAGKYYTEKINKAMGWKSKPRGQFTPEPLAIPEVVRKAVNEISDFESRFPTVLKRVKRETRNLLTREIKKNNKLYLEMVA